MNFIFVWFLALGGVIALAFVPRPWLLWSSATLLVLLFFVVCLPNIGRLVALWKIDGGFDSALRRQVFLADVGALATLYTIVAVVWSLPLASGGAIVGAVAALANSLVGGRSEG